MLLDAKAKKHDDSPSSCWNLTIPTQRSLLLSIRERWKVR